MEDLLFSYAKNAIKHWYLSLILGILFLIAGIWIFLTPRESYVLLAVIFSVIFFVTGVFEIFFYSANHNSIHNWGWGLAFGIVDLIIGLWLIINPILSIEVMPFFIGIMLMFISAGAMAISFDLKKAGIKEWGWLMATSILGIVFSFFMIWDPFFGGMAIVIWTALAFLTIGIFRIMLSFKLKQMNNALQQK